MKGYDEEKIPEFLRNYRNIAVVGISDNPERDSYRVAVYLKDHGYNIVPINPKLDMWEGIRAYPDLKSISKEAGVEIIDIFRKPEAVPGIVEEALQLNPKLIWMQEGVISEEAAENAKSHGVYVVLDRCMMKEHARLE